MRARLKTRVTGVCTISAGVFVISFEPPRASFRPGEHLYVSLPNAAVERAYSLYGGTDEPHWRILVREVPDGALTPALRRCRPGDPLLVSAPEGEFILPESEPPPGGLHVFLATGTGVAPFHCMIRSRPGLRYRLAHGTRRREDALPCPRLRTPGAIACLSQEPAREGEFQGRVTDWIEQRPLAPEGTRYYLCGRNEMIYDVFRRLRRRGVSGSHILTEVYF